jgi:hypothetical protein
MMLPDVPVPGEVRIALAQLGVIVPERFQAEPVRRQLAVASLRPVRAGLLADPGLAANVSHANTVRSLLRNKRLGRACESGRHDRRRSLGFRKAAFPPIRM